MLRCWRLSGALDTAPPEKPGFCSLELIIFTIPGIRLQPVPAVAEATALRWALRRFLHALRDGDSPPSRRAVSPGKGVVALEGGFTTRNRFSSEHRFLVSGTKVPCTLHTLRGSDTRVISRACFRLLWKKVFEKISFSLHYGSGISRTGHGGAAR